MKGYEIKKNSPEADKYKMKYVLEKTAEERERHFNKKDYPEFSESDLFFMEDELSQALKKYDFLNPEHEQRTIKAEVEKIIRKGEK